MKGIARAAFTVLRRPSYLIGFIVATSAVFLLFIYAPARLIPGNDFLFQLQTLSVQDHVLLTLLSMLIGLSLVMQFYLWRKLRNAKKCLASASSGIVGWCAALLGSLFGTATCGACIAVLFGFLGFGTVLFLIEYRVAFVVGSLILVFASLYFSSRYVNES